MRQAEPAGGLSQVREGARFLVTASADPNSSIFLCAPRNAPDGDHKIMSRHRGWVGGGFYSIVTCLPVLGLACLIALGLLAHPEVPVVAKHRCFDHLHILLYKQEGNGYPLFDSLVLSQHISSVSSLSVQRT